MLRQERILGIQEESTVQMVMIRPFKSLNNEQGQSLQLHTERSLQFIFSLRLPCKQLIDCVNHTVEFVIELCKLGHEHIGILELLFRF